MITTTHLGTANQHLADMALTMCIFLKTVVQDRPDLLTELQDFLYGATEDIEEVELTEEIDNIFDMGDELCENLAREFLQAVPDYPSDGEIDMDITIPTTQPGSIAARFYHDILMLYVSKLWSFVNTHAEVLSKTESHNSYQGAISLDISELDSIQL